MQKTLKIVLMLFICLGLAGNCFAKTAKERLAKNIRPPYALPDGKELSFSLPKSFKTYVFPAQEGVYFKRIIIDTPGDKSFRLKMEVFPNNYLSPVASFSKRENRIAGETEIREFLKNYFKDIKEYSLNKKLKIESFTGDNCMGFYFASKIKKNDVIKNRYFVQGVFLVKGYIVPFQLKGKDGSSKTYTELFKVVKSAKIDDAVFRDYETAEEEKLVTRLAFLAKEYKKIKTMTANAGVQVIKNKKVSKKAKNFVVILDNEKQSLRIDDHKKRVSIVAYPEDFYKYYNIFVKQAEGNNSAFILKSFIDFDWTLFLSPWRNDRLFIQEHDIKIKKASDLKKGLQLIEAKPKPFLYKFYGSMELIVNTEKNRVEKLTYSTTDKAVQMVAYFDYPEKTALPVPKTIRLRLLHNGELVKGKNIFLNSMKSNISLPSDIFAVDGKKG